MPITAKDVQELRERTGAGMMAAKKALEESKGNVTAAIELLRKRGEAKATERSGRQAHEGIVASYIHANNKLGTLVVLRCETDFVARTTEFQDLGHDLAMHVAAANPLYLRPDDIPADVLEKEKEIIGEQLAQEGIPEKVMSKVLEGKLGKFYGETCLLNQIFVKNPDQTVADLVTAISSRTGENIQIDRFVRFTI